MSNCAKCKFCNPENENFHILRSYLPSEYEYTVCNFSSDATNFKTRLRTNGKNQDYARKWLDDFQMHSKCTMRVERTYPNSGTKNVFKVDLRCQHNTRPRSDKVREKESCKNTDCPAKMGITIKRVVTERKSRSKDPHLPDFPTVIQIDFCHNHAILTPEILKHRSVLPDVKEKILALFKLGHNPATALDMHKYDLLLEHGENFEKICMDRALLPDPQFCYRLYYKIVKHSDMNEENPLADKLPPPILNSEKKMLSPLSSCENSAPLSNNPHLQSTDLSSEKKVKKKRKLESTTIDKKEMVTQLEDVLCKFCETEGFAGMQLIEDDMVMALCTPLMHRVHKFVKQSGDMVFVDAYGELEEVNCCRIFMLVTYSCIGALPLGCLVTTSETTPCIKAAIDLWKQVLPQGCFFNKTEGPDIFFTNDSEVEKQSLKSSFPKSHLLICLSHILQTSWTFVWDRRNAIKKEHRSLLLQKIKIILYSQTVEELEMNYAFAVGDSLVKSYSTFLSYLTYIYDHRHDWSLVYRRHLIPQSEDLSFFWETAMVVVKDPILSRTRTYNPLQVVDFLSRLDTYYERKLIDLVNNRFDNVRLSRFLFIELPREAYTITQNSENEYEVHNDTKDTVYQIDISLGMCECRTGRNGAPCKHQLLVYRNFPIPIYDCVPPSTQSEKNHLIQLATGQEIEFLSITKAVQSAIQDPTVISLPDAYPSDFFLNDSATCDTLTSAAIHSSLAQPTTTLTLETSALIQTMHDLGSNHDIAGSPLDDLPMSQDIQLTTAPSPVSNSIPPQTASDPPPPPLPISSGLEENVSDQQSVSDLLNQIAHKLKERTMTSPQTFKPALSTFLKNLENLSAESSLEYALYSFGKFSKSVMPLFQRKVVDNRLVGFQFAGELKKRKQSLKVSKVLKKLS